MRKELKKIDGVRATFQGTFVRFGEKNGWHGPEKTVLLENVKNEEGLIVTQHLWFNLTKGFQKLNLNPGDVVQFDARVAKYEKGYKGYREDVYKSVQTDYKLSHPSKLKKI